MLFARRCGVPEGLTRIVAWELALLVAILAAIATASDDMDIEMLQGHAGEDGEEPPPYFGEDEGTREESEAPEEYEYIETPHMDSTGTSRSERWKDADAAKHMQVFIEHPPEGFVYEGDVSIHVNAKGIPEGEGYSGMLYFGSGNPYPIPLDSLPVGISVTDLAPGNYSVKFMILDGERQPIGVDADVKFERRAPPGYTPAKADNSRFDSRVFEILIRFALAQQVDVVNDKNPFLEALRRLAKDNSECTTCTADGELCEADEILAQAAMLIFAVRGRDIEQALELLRYCGELGSVNCKFLLLCLDGLHERFALAAHEIDSQEFDELKRCALQDKSFLCRLAVAFRYRNGGLNSAETTLRVETLESFQGNSFKSTLNEASSCEEAATHYRLAADHAVMFSQQDSGSGPLHSLRLLEYTAVAAEQEKAEVEELRVVQAEQGNADAAAAVAIDRFFGTSYTGSGSKEEDKKSAAKLFEQAAAADNPLSLNNLGVMYQNGVGVAKNESKAFEFFSRSAALGNPWGINSMASCYIYGIGVAANRSRGIELWHAAAAKGNTAAHTNLGMLYREGHGPCPPYCRDYATGYYHLDQAASRGDADALLFLGLMIKAGEFVAPDCHKACMAFKQCAERGPASHLLLQGFMAWNGGDRLGAFIRYRLAAELGYRTALANIGYMYEHGIEDDKLPIPPDLPRAMHFYYLCALEGDQVCRRRLGDMHYYGQGVAVNYTSAALHYAQNSRDAQSCFNLAWLTERGLGVAKDREAAKELYERASSLQGGKRLAFEASPQEFSPVPAQLAITKMALEDEVCALLADMTALLPTLSFPATLLAQPAAWVCEAACGEAAAGGRVVGSEEWLTLFGVPLEWVVALLVGVCTLSSVLLGPCFLHLRERGGVSRGCRRARGGAQAYSSAGTRTRVLILPPPTPVAPPGSPLAHAHEGLERGSGNKGVGGVGRPTLAHREVKEGEGERVRESGREKVGEGERERAEGEEGELYLAGIQIGGTVQGQVVWGRKGRREDEDEEDKEEDEVDDKEEVQMEAEGAQGEESGERSVVSEASDEEDGSDGSPRSWEHASAATRRGSSSDQTRTQTCVNKKHE